MHITFEAQGIIQLDRSIRVSLDGIKDMKPIFQDALEIIEERKDDIFDKDGKNLAKSPTWKPLAASTKTARKNRWGYYKQNPNNPGINRWTGKLQDTTKITVTSTKGVFEYTQPYAEYVTKKRALIDLDSKTNQNIIKAIQKRIYKIGGIFGRQL